MAAMMMAKEWGIRIYTISLKEAEEKRAITGQDGKKMEVPASISQSDELLAQMAEGTGGIFRKAHDFESLQSVYAEIDELETSDLRAQPYTIYEEVFWPWAVAALFCLLLAQLLEATVFGRIP
jgi:Ca-activated chloride channel family protein